MDKQQARRLANLLRVAREELGPDTTLIRLETLLRVASESDQSQRELGEAMKVVKTVVSQNVLNLSASTAMRREGPDLVAQTVDPMERRRSLVNVTPKGRKLLERFDRAMTGKRA